MTILASLLLATTPLQAGDICSLDNLPGELEPAELDSSLLDDVIAEHPDCMPAHFLRGFAHLDDDDNDRDAAITHFENALALEPDNANLLLWMGRVHGMIAGERSSLGSARKAKKYFEQAIEADPDNLDARSGLASYHRNAPWIAGGRMKAAYQQVAEIEKRDTLRGKVERAHTLMADEKRDQALELYREAIAENPDQADLAVQYAVTMHSLEEYGEAHRVLRAVTRDNDADLMALYQLGRTAALSGEFIDDGHDALKRYLERGEAGEKLPFGAAPAWWRMGMIEQHAQRHEAARNAFERALAVEPGHQQATEALQSMTK